TRRLNRESRQGDTRPRRARLMLPVYLSSRVAPLVARSLRWRVADVHQRSDPEASMSAITAFSEADTLRFQTLEYTLDGPSQVAGAKSNQPGCVTKNAGELGFKLSARDDLRLYSIAEIKIS